MEEGMEKVTEGMGGMGQDMGWEGTGKERRKREERGYSPAQIDFCTIFDL